MGCRARLPRPHRVRLPGCVLVRVARPCPRRRPHRPRRRARPPLRVSVAFAASRLRRRRRSERRARRRSSSDGRPRSKRPARAGLGGSGRAPQGSRGGRAGLRDERRRCSAVHPIGRYRRRRTCAAGQTPNSLPAAVSRSRRTASNRIMLSRKATSRRRRQESEAPHSHRSPSSVTRPRTPTRPQ